MEPFTTAFLANITANITNQILSALGRRLRDELQETDKDQALRRCVQAGVTAMLATVMTDMPEEKDLLAEIFERFADDPDVGRELGELFRGSLPEMGELKYLFEQAGYDPETLPGLAFEKGMETFEAAFISSAMEEPVLQGEIQTKLQWVQTQLQRELLENMRQLVAFLREARSDTLGIASGKVLGRVEGDQRVVYLLPGPDDLPIERETGNLRSAYLNRLFETTARLSLSGIDPKAAGDPKAFLKLDAVYTALLTQSVEGRDAPQPEMARDRDASRQSALEQLNLHKKLVLLGDPGSGKSTFVNFVAMCMAGEAMGRHDANLDRLTTPLPWDEGEEKEKPQPWEHGVLIPVRIILRDFAARGLPPAGQQAMAEHLWAFISGELEAAAIGDYARHLKKELMERGGLILLDGLDEVPEADRRREQIKQAVEDFAATFHLCRVLVTSRTYAYQQQDWRLPDFVQAVLAPFTEGQIRSFVDHWYAHIAGLRGMHPDDARGKAELLKRAIFGSSRLHVLAERPLLLTLMASLHAWRGESLPERREELYADTVNLLLDWWENPKVVRDAQGEMVVLQPSLAEWLETDRDRVLDLLAQLAYQAHASQPDMVGTADIPESGLVKSLMDLSQNPDVRPALLMEYLSQRAGLILPRGVGVYTFPHRTLQEYLAACYLTDHEYPEKVANLARKDPVRWREVALLAGAKAARGTSSAVWSLVPGRSTGCPALPPQTRT